MATIEKWTPFGVALDITATGGTVVRTSATSYTVVVNVSWETYYNGARTNYGMTATSGGVTKTISAFDGTNRSSGSTQFTGTYSISDNGLATKLITVTFRNFNTDNGDSATKNVVFHVSVPAWTSYTVTYNANGGSNPPMYQTKWKDQTLTLSSTIPTKTGHSFLGWATSASATSAAYAAGGSYTANANATLYAVWKADTYTVLFDANGGSGAPSAQTKTYGKTLTLSSAKPTRENYNFLGWGTSASATTVAYAAGASYTANAGITLYAIWSLAYTKPRIWGMSVVRCDSAGTASSDGTNALVKFNWACDRTLASIVIAWTSGSGTNSQNVAASGASGSVIVVVGNGSLSSATTYTITATVTDSVDKTEDKRTLNSQKFTIDCLPEDRGIAFGKTAELDNTAEFEFDAKFNNAVYGKALGMDRLPTIPEYSDFNNYMTTGCYAVHSNAMAATCSNIPVTVAGRLEVWSSTGEGVRDEQWSYLTQRFVPYDENPVWERTIQRYSDNSWRYGDWYITSLNPYMTYKLYNKSAITIASTSNTTLTALNTYTKIAFNAVANSMGSKLTFTDNSVRIGSNVNYVKVNAQVLLKAGSVTGNRHIRIQKNSGGTITSVAWTCIYASGGVNTLYTLAPIIVPVSEGDLIFCVYYTSDTTDYLASGSAANGYQSYLTVEDI